MSIIYKVSCSTKDKYTTKSKKFYFNSLKYAEEFSDNFVNIFSSSLSDKKYEAKGNLPNSMIDNFISKGIDAIIKYKIIIDKKNYLKISYYIYAIKLYDNSSVSKEAIEKLSSNSTL